MNLQYMHDRLRSALWKAGGKPRKASETRDAVWTLYTELDEHMAAAEGPCVSTANGKTHLWGKWDGNGSFPVARSFQAYWRCVHFPSAIQNWTDGLNNCWVCGAKST